MSIKQLNQGEIVENNRFIMYHKHPTSARLLFFASKGSVCHFDNLPSESKIVETHIDEERVVEYPENLIPTIKEGLAISEDILEIETTFQTIAKANSATFTIYLVNFNTEDPPHEQLAHLKGKFISIIEARSLKSIESELLGLVYSFLME